MTTPNSNKRVSIIICTCNRAEHLRLTLAVLAKSAVKRALKTGPAYRSYKTLQARRRNAAKRRQEAEWYAAQTVRESSLAPIAFKGRSDYADFIQMDGRCMIEPDVVIWISEEVNAEPRLTLGDRAFIAKSAFIGVHLPISIGKNALIGAYCYIISANHCYESREIPIIDQGFTGAPVIIEEDAWLGTHVVVLPGVTIGKGAIVAAGAVVTRSIPAYEIWGGVPARFLKPRP